MSKSELLLKLISLIMDSDDLDGGEEDNAEADGEEGDAEDHYKKTSDQEPTVETPDTGGANGVPSY